MGIRFSKQSNIKNKTIWMMYLTPMYLWIFVFIIQPHKVHIIKINNIDLIAYLSFKLLIHKII